MGEGNAALLSLFLAAALLLARATAALFNRIRLPPLLGEITGGVLLGQALRFWNPGGVRRFIEEGGPLEVFGFIGLLMLLFLSGLETRLSDLKTTGKAGVLSALGGAVVPMALGFFTARALGLGSLSAILVGAVMTPTSVGVPLSILMEKNVLRSAAGSTVLSAAILDDIMAVLLLTVILATGSILSVGVKVVLFIVVAFVLGKWLVAPFLDLNEHFPLPMGLLTGSLVAMFFLAFLAEEAGLAALTGAFTAGLFVGRVEHSAEVIREVEVVGYGVFIPLFFLQVGTFLDPRAFLRIGWPILVLLAVSMASKAAGSWAGARMGGLSPRDSNVVAAGMLPRLEVALIMAALATSQGLVTGNEAEDLWTFVLANGAISLILTPLILNRILAKPTGDSP